MSVQEVEGDIRGLWKQRTFAYPVFGELASKISSVDARRGEVVQDFPNSVDHSDMYVTFLIECATDFHRAMLQRDRVDGMESGEVLRRRPLLQGDDMCVSSVCEEGHYGDEW
jgi:hypothetical protein